MISFTDKKYYVKGTCQAVLMDPCTGDVIYSSNKFQTGNITTSVSTGEIRGGMGNGIATILPSDTALNVEFTAADFSLAAKAAQLGATLSYNAPVMDCIVVEGGSGGTLTLPESIGTPVAPLGYSSPICYVEIVGSAAPIATIGVAYPINPTTRAISGFVASSGNQYKVFYFVNKVESQVATISSLFNPATLYFMAQLPVFSNDSCASDNSGSRVGWLYITVPRLKLGANGGVVGDQTTPDTTSVSGMAVAYDGDVVSATCTDCNAGTLAYYVLVPDDAAGSVAGLAVVGGSVSVAVNKTKHIPVRIVMANGQLVVPTDNVTGFTYTATGAPSGTTVNTSGNVSASSTAGDFEVTINYAYAGETYSTVVNVSVTE